MTFIASVFQVCEVPLGEPLARVTDEGKLIIYPEGMGKGVALHMDVRDWEQVKHSADAAIRVARNRLAQLAIGELASYRATAGNNGGEP